MSDFVPVSGPGFWTYETSGVLFPAVEAFLHGHELTPEHIAALRAYLRQWINATAWDHNPYAGDKEHTWLARMRARCDWLVSRQAIAEYVDELVAKAMDPF